MQVNINISFTFGSITGSGEEMLKSKDCFVFLATESQTSNERETVPAELRTLARY